MMWRFLDGCLLLYGRCFFLVCLAGFCVCPRCTRWHGRCGGDGRWWRDVVWVAIVPVWLANLTSRNDAITNKCTKKIRKGDDFLSGLGRSLASRCGNGCGGPGRTVAVIIRGWHVFHSRRLRRRKYTFAPDYYYNVRSYVARSVAQSV